MHTYSRRLPFIFRKRKPLGSNRLGIYKKSFPLFFHGGEIWIEHLDALPDEAALKRKFRQDILQIKRPSSSSLIAVNLDETKVTKEILDYILNAFASCNRPLRKVVFVGLPFRMKRYLKKQGARVPFTMACIDDFEKAKIALFE